QAPPKHLVTETFRKSVPANHGIKEPHRQAPLGTMPPREVRPLLVFE
ncbi:unnamed protein product, partial [Discosporangium mesarthrocarpum]